MCLEIVRICKRLYIRASIALVVGDMKSNSRYKRPIVSFNLPVGLRMIRSGSEFFNPKYAQMEGTHL